MDILGMKVLLRRPDGFEEEVSAHCERLIVGSGAHCEVRLPVELAAVEHVELSLVSGRVYAKARSFAPAPTIGGNAFVQAFVEPDVAIGIGELRIFASVAADAGPKADPGSTPGSLRERSAQLALVALLAAAAGGLFFLKKKSGLPEQPTEAPALWAAPEAACPQAAPDVALAFAGERRRVAEGKRERRAFHVPDGVAAVPLFDVAAACYAVGGDSADAQAMTEAATRLRAQVSEDYHAHQVRLEHALSIQDKDTARQEVRALRAFTSSLAGPYVAWLSDLERSLRPASKEEKKKS